MTPSLRHDLTRTCRVFRKVSTAYTRKHVDAGVSSSSSTPESKHVGDQRDLDGLLAKRPRLSPGSETLLEQRCHFTTRPPSHAGTAASAAASATAAHHRHHSLRLRAQQTSMRCRPWRAAPWPWPSTTNSPSRSVPSPSVLGNDELK